MTDLLPDIYLTIPIPVLRFDKATRRVLAVNKAARKWFSATELKKKSLDELISFESKTPHNIFGTVNTAKNGTFRFKGYFTSLDFKRKKIDLLVLHDWPGTVEHERSGLENIVHRSYLEIYRVKAETFALDFANASALKNLGYSAAEIKNLRMTDLFHFPDEIALKALLSPMMRTESESLKLQLRFQRRSGSSYDAEVLIQVLEAGKYFLIIANDITDKVAAEKKLLESVLEKETLIKEIHHRVKNNLQLISSIIYLKLATVEQPAIRDFLEDTRQKIRSIALIHERLLQTENLDKVEISDYLGKLVHDLEVTYLREDLALRIHTDFDNTLMKLDTAIICGLIVNELVTNAMKHAFTGRTTGRLSIVFRDKKHDGQCLLSIADDGVSLPAHIQPGKSTSFGMQLVDVFVKQLGGRFEIIREKGTNFQIYF